MIIYYKIDGVEHQLDIVPDDDSYRFREVMGDHTLTLYFSLAEHVEIPLGAYCVYENETYTLERPESLNMKHTRHFEYTVIFDSVQSKAGQWKFINTVDRRLKFQLTATPREHLQMFVDNMNQRDGGWSVGRCIEGAEKTLSYNHAYCIEALSQMADEWETEYEFVGKQVSLGKVEYNRDNPLPLSYGEGFKPGVGRSNYEDSRPIEILYVQGGERNIDWDKYGNKELLLPKSQLIRFDGQHFEDAAGFDGTKARKYATDAYGLSICRADKPLSSHAEDSLDLTEIYPNWEHTVSKAVEIKEGVWDIYAENTPECPNNSPSNLNYAGCRIDGETATVGFQTGELAGKGFDIVQTAGSLTGYDYATKKFELVSQQIDGLNMPGGTFIPRVGDKFRLFGVRLPDAYICDNATKSGASWNMFREGVKYLYENEEQKFTLTGELDGIWSKKDWNNIGGKIRLGGFVQFSDERFQQEGVLVRIIGIKDYINNPHSPEITLSNSTAGRSVRSDLRKIESNEVVVDTLHKEALQFTKRRYRDSLETVEMLKEAMLDNFTNSINPVAVQTMAALIGDVSLQFRFVNNLTNPVPVIHTVTYDQATKILSAPAGLMQHMTLGIDTISAVHASGEYKFWRLAAFETPPLTEGDKQYYLYAKVIRTDQIGMFHISEHAVGMEAVEGYYHFLMGVLNSELDGERSYVSLYGFTEVLPGRITTDRIVSADGKTYFDLSGGEIGGRIVFRSSTGEDKTLPELESDAAADSTAKADAAKTAAETYAKTKAEAERVKAEAYADGIVTAEEARAIADATTKANAARDAAVAAASADAAAKDNAILNDLNDFKSKAVLEETIISGGYLKNSLIDTDNLLVKNIYSKSGNFRTTDDGTVRGVGAEFRDGKFTNVTVQGSLCSPFVAWSASKNVFDGDKSKGIGKNDNVVMPLTSGSTDQRTLGPNDFTWSADNSGRIIRIVNYKWSTGTASGNVYLTAPSGKYFYENGKAHTRIRMSRECLVMLGYGTPSTFYGWIVLTRVDVYTEGYYGMPLKVLYQGIFNPAAPLMMDRVWSSEMTTTGIDEEWEIKYIQAGYYRVRLPRYIASSNWHVMLTGCIWGLNGSITSSSGQVYASLVAKGSETVNNRTVSYFDVKVADDDSLNEGGFMFQVIGTYDWVIPTAATKTADGSGSGITVQVIK